MRDYIYNLLDRIHREYNLQSYNLDEAISKYKRAEQAKEELETENTLLKTMLKYLVIDIRDLTLVDDMEMPDMLDKIRGRLTDDEAELKEQGINLDYV